jgi:RNA polymerase sigma-70 factor (ECF subfamily)
VLNAAMRELSDEERQIVMLHAVSGLKHIEIAKLLTLPLPTVLSKYSRAKKKLQNLLKEENGFAN